ncbi:hypothetical protein F7725_010570, partial [Dissostichus mawsoni]
MFVSEVLCYFEIFCQTRPVVHKHVTSAKADDSVKAFIFFDFFSDDEIILLSPVRPVAEGRSVTLSCKFKTENVYNLDFYKDDKLIQNDTRKELTISAVSKSQRTNQGPATDHMINQDKIQNMPQYSTLLHGDRCLYETIGGPVEAGNGASNEPEESLYSNVAADAVLTIEPNWTTFFTGESVTFKCDITGDKDSSWYYAIYRNDQEWLPYDKHESYELHDLTPEYSGAYQCFFDQKDSRKESNKIYLTVSERPEAVLTVSPSWPSPGASVTLNCSVDHPSAGWSFYWYKAVPQLSYNSYSYELLPGSEKGTEQHLFIIDGQTHTAGYVCSAGREDQVYYSWPSEPKFVWYGDLNSAASLTVSPDSVQHFTETSVSLSCEGNSTEWRVRTKSDYLYLCSSWGTMTGSRCTITSSWVSGVFWCESETGQFSNAVNITKDDDEIILLSPVRPVAEGRSVTLSCKFKTENVYNLDFYKDDKLIQNDTRKELTISAVSKSQRTNQGPATDHMINQDKIQNMPQYSTLLHGASNEPEESLYSNVAAGNFQSFYLHKVEEFLRSRLSVGCEDGTHLALSTGFFFLYLLYRGQAQDAVLTIEPNWTTFFTGESVTFKCDITGDKDSSWYYAIYRNDQQWLPYDKHESYELHDLTPEYSEGSRKESNKIYLTVSERPEAVLTVSPSWPSPGASVTLNCSVDHPSAGWSFYWYKAVPQLSYNSYSYELLPGSEKGTEQHLFIIDGQTHTAGYVCSAGREDQVYYSWPSEPKFVWWRSANKCLYHSLPGLEVCFDFSIIAKWNKVTYFGNFSFTPASNLNSAASLTVSPDSVQHFTETSVSLSCEGNSTEWRVRTKSDYLYLCSSWGTMTGSRCTITSSWVSGVFWCESETGQFSNAVNITKDDDEIILLSPVRPVAEGRSVTLSCKFKTENVYNLDFYKNDKLIQNDTRKELTISAVSKSDEGFYKCKGRDSARASGPGEASQFPILLIVGLLCGVLLIILLLLFLYLYRKSKDACCIRSQRTNQGPATDHMINQDKIQNMPQYSTLLHGDRCLYETIGGPVEAGNGTVPVMNQKRAFTQMWLQFQSFYLHKVEEFLRSRLSVGCEDETHLALSTGFFFLYLLYRGQAQDAVLTIEPNWTTFFTGESVTFKCDITGDKDSSWYYAIYRNDQEWLPYDKHESYELHDLTPGYSGAYQCFFDQKGSRKESNKIYLTVSERPEAVLTVSPSWPSPGASVTLNCSVDHPSAGWSFYWYKAVPQLSYNSYSYELLPGSEKGTEQHLFIIDGQTHTAGYVCSAGREDRVYYSGPSEPKFVWSGDLNSAASLTVSPDSVQHFTETSVSLSCEGNSTEWRVRTKSDYLYLCSSWGTMTGSTCTITSSWVSGVFWCESETGQFSNAVNITKDDDEIILLSPVRPVAEGRSVTLSCKFKTENNDTRKELTISAVSKSDEGFYKCKGDSARASGPGEASQFPILLIVGLLCGVLLIILLLLFLYLYRKSKDACCIRLVQRSFFFYYEHDSSDISQRTNQGPATDHMINQDKIQNMPQYSTLLHGASNEPEESLYSNVAADAVLTIEPNWTTFFTGESVTFKCDITGDKDSSWYYAIYRNDQEWLPYDKHESYELHDLTPGYSGAYQCFFDQKGSRKESNKIYLTVSERPEAVLTVSPSWPSPGASVTLNCSVDHPSAGWSFYWYKAVPQLSYNSYSYELLPGSEKGTEQHLFIIDGQTHTAGYVCAGREDRVYYSGPSEPKFVWSGDLNSAASLTVSPDSVQHFTETSVSLSCEGNSTEWRVRTKSDYLYLCSSWGTMTGSTCTITSSWVSGVFWCESETGQFSNAVNITKDDDEIILLSPVRPVAEGRSVTLSCKFKTENVYNLDFYKDDKLIQNDTRKELTISAVSKSDEGFYKCKQRDSARASGPGEASQFPILLIVGLLCGVLLIILLLLYLYRKSKDNACLYETIKGPEEPANDESRDAIYSVLELKNISK